MAKKKITETGPLNYKALQDELNSMNDEERQVALDFLKNIDISRKSPGERLLAGVAINDPVEIPTNPDFGESKYDPDFPSLEQYYNPNQIRFEKQGAWSRLGVGVAKIIPRAVTLIPETFGVAMAGAEALFSDKSFADALKNQFENNIGFKVDDFVDDNLKIYRPDDYDKMNLLQRMGTSSFWSDDIIANLGFQFGSSAIFKITTKAVAKSLVKATEKAIVNGSKFARGAQSAIPMLAAGYVSSSGEAGVEARGFYNDKMQSLQSDLYEELQKNLAELDSYVVSPEMAGQIEQMKIDAINEYERKLNDMKQIVSEEAAKLYWYNKTVLGISNMLQFGMLFKSGYMGNFSDIPTAVVKGQIKNLTPKSALLNIAKGLIAEGGEEGGQHIGTDIADLQSEGYIQDYINNAYDIHAVNTTKSFMSDFGKIAAENMNDVDFWEEFMSGAIMGGLFPHPYIDKNKKGKNSIKLEGGIKDIFDQKTKYEENQKKIDDLNNKLSSFDNQTILKAANVIFNSMERQKAAENIGDRKIFEDENVIQAATLIASLSELGRGDIVLSRLNELEDYFSTEQNREKYATTDISQGGASQKGADGSELNEYARLSTDEDRREWLQERFSTARQMLKDMNTIAYNIRRISPSEINSEDMIPIMIERYRLYDTEKRLGDRIDDIRSALLSFGEIDNVDEIGQLHTNMYGDIYEDAQDLSKNKIRAGEQTSELNERISTIINNLKPLLDNHTLLENKVDINTKVILAKNLGNLLKDLITKYQSYDNPYIGDVISTVMEVNDYIDSYISLHEKLNKILDNPSVVSEAREKAEKKLAQNQKNKEFEKVLHQFNLADAENKVQLYDSLDEEQRKFVDANANKEDINLLKQKNKLKNAFRNAIDKFNHHDISEAMKQNAKSEIINLINIAQNSNDLNDLSKILFRIQALRGDQDVFRDYIIEQAASIVSKNKTFESAFKNFVPTISSNEVELAALQMSVSKSNDGNDTPGPTIVVGEKSKEDDVESEAFADTDLNDIDSQKAQPANSFGQPSFSEESKKSDKPYIYPIITEESASGKYERNHKPFWENSLTSELEEWFSKNNPNSSDGEKRAFVEKYISNIKASPVQPITEVSMNPENIKDGTYRGYYDIWKYLDDNGAFEYVNKGTLKKGDEVWFKVETSLGDDVILIMTTTKEKPDGQVVGVLPDRGVIGINGLRNAIKSGKNPKTTVSEIMNGVVQYGNEERTLNNGDLANILLAIVNENGDFKGLTKNVNIEKWNEDFDKFNGSVVALIKTSRGTYFPVPLKCKVGFNNFEDENPVNNQINDILNKMSGQITGREFQELYNQLAKLIYLGDIRINAYEQSGENVKEIRKENNNEGSIVYQIGIERKDGSDKMTWIDADSESTKKELIDAISVRASRYNVITSGLSDSNYINNLIASGILSSNVITFDGLHSSWFVLPYWDEKEEKFSDKVEKPQSKDRSKNPVNGIDSISKSISFKFGFDGNVSNIVYNFVNNQHTFVIDGQNYTPQDINKVNKDVTDALFNIMRALSIFNNPNKGNDLRYVKLPNNDSEFVVLNLINGNGVIVEKDKDGVFKNPDAESVKNVEEVYRKKMSLHSSKKRISPPPAPVSVQKPSNVDKNDLAASYQGDVNDEYNFTKIEGNNEHNKKIDVLLSLFGNELLSELKPISYLYKGNVYRAYGLYSSRIDAYYTFAKEGNDDDVYFIVSKNGARITKPTSLYMLQSSAGKEVLKFTKEKIFSLMSEETLDKICQKAADNKKGLLTISKQQEDKVESKKEDDKEVGQPVVSQKASTLQQLEKDSENYVQSDGQYTTSDGRTFVRLHRLFESLENRKPSYIPSDDKPMSSNGLDSAQIGTRTDALLRHLFNSRGKDIEGAKVAANDKNIELKKGSKYIPLDDAYMDKVIASAMTIINSLGDVNYSANNIRIGTTINGLDIAGEIDFVIERPDGTLVVWDFKTSKYGEGSKYYPTNNENYKTQLNFYAEALRRNGHNAVVGGLFIINTNDKSENYGTIEQANLPDSGISSWMVQPFGEDKSFSFNDSIKKQVEVEQPNSDSPAVNTDTALDGLDVSAFLRLQKEDDDTSELMSEDEMKWLESVIPDSKNRILFMETLGRVGNKMIYGKFKSSVIYLLKGGIRGTGYHESFHFVSNALMSSQEQKRVYKAARKLWGVTTVRDTEERLADAFMNFMIDEEMSNKLFSLREKETSPIKKLFNGIKQFLRTLLGLENPQEVLDRVFYNIKEQKYKNKKIKNNNSEFYMYGEQMDRIMNASNLNGTDLTRIGLYEDEFSNGILVNLKNGVKKLGYKPNDLHVNYSIVNGFVKINSVTLKSEKIFDREEYIQQISEVIPRFSITQTSISTEMMTIDSLNNEQRDYVERNVGVELWDTLDNSVKQNILQCI